MQGRGGGCWSDPPLDTTGYGKIEGGTHPTGMHSCFTIFTEVSYVCSGSVDTGTRLNSFNNGGLVVHGMITCLNLLVSFAFLLARNTFPLVEIQSEFPLLSLVRYPASHDE